MRELPRVVTFCVLGGLSGCQLLGYDSNGPRVASEDGGGTREDGGVEDATSLDARADARLEDARADVVLATPDAACAMPNACGGCSELTTEPSAMCGVCGLGSYACDGTDALACEDGDTRPSATGTLIDDWDDDDELTADRLGYTYAYSDGSPGGTLTPPSGSRVLPTPGGAANSAGSARVTGSGHSNYAGMIVRLDREKAECTYDASSKRGIGFWVKGSPGVTLYFGIATVATRDAAYCGDQCNDFHGAVITLTSEWRNVTYQFTDLKQEGWGMPASFDPGQMRYIQFGFAGNVSFDLYIDELSFY